MTAPSNGNPLIPAADIMPGYDPIGHTYSTALHLTNVQIDTAVTPNVLYGDLVASVTFPSGLGITSDYPVGATPINATSGVKANATATATLPGTGGVTTYITGFDVTGSGATVGLPVTVTASNLQAALSWIYTATAGALLANTPLSIRFDPPLPATGQNTAIVVSCPALGLGNLNNVVNAYGYQL
jgi:hypothetical protein